MNKRILILAAFAVLSILSVMAQDDDMYFVGKKHQKADASRMRSVVSEVADDDTPAYYCGSLRSVDEYNRRGRYRYSNDSLRYQPDSILVSREDYENSMKMKRFDGYYDKVLVVHDPYYYDPWYYDSWYWHTRWYDPWYDPWYGPHYWGWHGPYYYSSWYHPHYWGGWYGTRYWGHNSTWVRTSSPRYITHHSSNATTRHQYVSDSRNRNSRNVTTQRGNSFSNRSYADTPTRNYSTPTTSRGNSFGGVTRSSGFSGGGSRSMGGGAGVSRGGGFSGGGHGGRR